MSDSKDERIVIQTDKAPSALGAYSQAIKANGMVYVSGMIGLSPESRKLVSDDTAEQAKQALENMKVILEEAGSSMEKVVSVQVLMRDIADWEGINAVYAPYFPEAPPARAAYAVVGLPAGAKVELTAIALA